LCKPALDNPEPRTRSIDPETRTRSIDPEDNILEERDFTAIEALKLRSLNKEEKTLSTLLMLETLAGPWMRTY